MMQVEILYRTRDSSCSLCAYYRKKTLHPYSFGKIVPKFIKVEISYRGKSRKSAKNGKFDSCILTYLDESNPFIPGARPDFTL